MMEVLDAVARRYGQRPSDLVGERNPFAALSLDIAAMKWGLAAEEVAAMRARQKARRRR